MSAPGDAQEEPVPVSLGQLFQVFGLIGLTSFGGGLSGWMYRELVEARGWMSPQEFLAGLSLARTMPGANVVNLSIWAGFRMRGGIGALIAVSSVLAGPVVMIVALAALYRGWGHSALAHQVLLGIAAASLGISFSIGARTLKLAAATPVYAVILVLAFIGVGVLRWPMLPIVAVLAPISIAWTTVVDSREG